MFQFQVTDELLSNKDCAPAFSEVGVGKFLANSFNACLRSRRGYFPNRPRGRSLLMVADFSGQHAKQRFDTYTFLLLDIGQNGDWIARQRYFREQILQNKRRMSFKALNDAQRRRALVPFLRMAAGIDGCLAQFAISKAGGSLFNSEIDDELVSSSLSMWKPHVRERLLRILHLSGFLLSGLSVPEQDLLWIIDEDEIAANISQLTQLTEVFGHILSAYSTHALRHIRCGTTQSDDGSLSLEDITSVADLTAGALGEVCTAFVDQALIPRSGIITPLPSALTWKTRLIASWLASDECRLRKVTAILNSGSDLSKITTSVLRWETQRGSLILPRPMM